MCGMSVHPHTVHMPEFNGVVLRSCPLCFWQQCLPGVWGSSIRLGYMPMEPKHCRQPQKLHRGSKGSLQSLQREVPASVMKIVSFCSFGCPSCPLSWEPFETYRYELLPLLVEDGSRVKLVNISYKCHHSENWCRTPNSQLSTKHVPNHISMLCKPKRMRQGHAPTYRCARSIRGPVVRLSSDPSLGVKRPVSAQRVSRQVSALHTAMGECQRSWCQLRPSVTPLPGAHSTGAGETVKLGWLDMHWSLLCLFMLGVSC